MAPPISDRWAGNCSLWRCEVGSPERIRPRLLADLLRDLEGVPGDSEVTGLTVDGLRELLAAHKRPPVELGAEITDPERRVTYRCLIGRGEGRVWLKHCEVIPHEADPDPAIWRIPAQALADATALELARAVDTAEGGDTSGVVIWGDTIPEGGKPTPEDLSAMLARGETRKTIAKWFGRSESRVDDWLRIARRDRPDLPWPERRRGPKPRNTQTNGGKGRRTTKRSSK